MGSQIDFGYAAIYAYGHLIITAIAAPLLYFAVRRKWHKVLTGSLAVITLWSLAACFTLNVIIGLNSRHADLPTQSFLASGAGSVLDMGAGSGRSALMVLEARPKATLVALDAFAQSYTEHFHEDSAAGQARLLNNLKIAGVADRATIKQADMRELPYPSNTFDAIVSAYAIDHLGFKGTGQALAEANRVLKPGGDFLLMVVSKDAWLNFIWGPVGFHGGTPKMERWTDSLKNFGFQVTEKGTRPITIWVLSRKLGAPAQPGL